MGARDTFICPDSIKFRNITKKDFLRICELESQAYINGDQDSPEFINFRLENAQEYFYGLEINKNIVGYINGTLSNDQSYNKKLLNTHEKEGENLYIHSVVIDKAYRGKGLGQKMFSRYIDIVKKKKNIKSIILISKKELGESFYKTFGFEFIRERPDIVYGSFGWYEMKLKI